MFNKNTQKKKEIDNILAGFATKIFFLKKKRDAILLSFIEVLKEKKLDELKKSIKQL